MREIHLGLIPDGNRRWARAHGLPVEEGHRRGAKVMEEFLQWCLEEEIQEVSVYALSTENMQKRSPRELNSIYQLLAENFKKLLDSEEIYKYEVRVNVFGRYCKLPDYVVEAARKLVRATAKHSKHFLNVLVAYGAHDELLSCVRSLLRNPVARLTHQALMQRLWVKRPLDLVIRTGGDRRLSNFLLYQAAYAELFFVDKYWPDFTKEDFLNCLRTFEATERRFGGNSESV